MVRTRSVDPSMPDRRAEVISLREARNRRVQTLATLVRSGRYHVDLDALADALIERDVLGSRRSQVVTPCDCDRDTVESTV